MQTENDADQPEYLASCFISYNHKDKPLAQGIAEGLNSLGYFVWIDEGQLVVGDSLVGKIGDAIGQVDFLVALISENSVSSTWCQKEISLAMSGEIARKGITVLPCRVGSTPLPNSLADKLWVAISADDVSAATDTLAKSMQTHLSPAQPIPPRRRQSSAAPTKLKTTSITQRGSKPTAYDPSIDVRMTGIDTNSVTKPREDGTRGSALYRVPVTLSPSPDRTWGELLVRHWNSPSRFTTMHRPGIASVSGDRIVLDGTTIDEIEQYHLATLKLAVAAANADRRALAQREQAERVRADEQRAEHERRVREAEKRLKFDDD